MSDTVEPLHFVLSMFEKVISVPYVVALAKAAGVASVLCEAISFLRASFQFFDP